MPPFLLGPESIWKVHVDHFTAIHGSPPFGCKETFLRTLTNGQHGQQLRLLTHLLLGEFQQYNTALAEIKAYWEKVAEQARREPPIQPKPTGNKAANTAAILASLKP